jgi:hypothetical protein
MVGVEGRLRRRPPNKGPRSRRWLFLGWCCAASHPAVAARELDGVAMDAVCSSSLAGRGGEVGRPSSSPSSSGSVTCWRSKWRDGPFIPLLELASMVVAVSAEVCKPAAHGSLHLELFPGGLSTTSFVIPLGCTTVGQLLATVLTLFVGVIYSPSPCGSSLTAVTQAEIGVWHRSEYGGGVWT